jgi:putative transposase
MLKGEEVFIALPAKTSQQIIILLGKNWKSFFKGIKGWAKHNKNYPGMPKLPNYKDKNGRNVVMFDYTQGSFSDGRYYFPRRDREKIEYIGTNITKDKFKLLMIVPYGNCYKIELVYEKEILEKEEYNNSYIAIDLGINNLATLTNNTGMRPVIINGKILKSINQYYNKLQSKAMSYVGTGSSNRIQRIRTKRNNIVENHLHKVSKHIIEYCKENNFDNIIIGYNPDWQRNSNIGSKNNQLFVQIPFAELIRKIQYKAEENGVRVFLVHEEYTSQSSFLDNDILPDHSGSYEFSGKRKSRGLYKTNSGTLINADVNGSYNILRKRIPEFKCDDRIEGVALRPVKFNVA